MKEAKNDSMSFIDVRDCAAIHVAAYEKGKGRYMCLAKSLHWNEILTLVKKFYPKMNDFKLCENPVRAT